MEEKKKAIALRYDQEKDKAPVVVAKGQGSIAEKIIKLARENNIPVVEDEELIEAMINMDVYEEIPPELYRAIAQVLIFVKYVRKKTGVK